MELRLRRFLFLPGNDLCILPRRYIPGFWGNCSAFIAVGYQANRTSSTNGDQRHNRRASPPCGGRQRRRPLLAELPLTGALLFGNRSSCLAFNRIVRRPSMPKDRHEMPAMHTQDLQITAREVTARTTGLDAARCLPYASLLCLNMNAV